MYLYHEIATNYGIKPWEVPYLDPFEFAFCVLTLRAKSEIADIVSRTIKGNGGVVFPTMEIV